MALSKGCLIFGLILKPVMSCYLSICHIVCLCLPVFPPFCLIAIFLSVCLAVRICLSTCLSVTACLSVSLLPICPPVRRPVPLLVCLSSRLHLCLPVCLPDCLSVCLPACLSACLPACLSLCLFVSLPTYLSLNLDNLQNIKTVY